jgi:putative transcriptional regulator
METPLAPGFLVAAPGLQDPFFRRSVVLLVEHDHAEGTFGVLINRSAGVDMDRIFEELDITPTVNPSSLPIVLEGGPVTPEMGWVLHSLDWKTAESRPVGEYLAVTSCRRILEDIASGCGPTKFRFCIGYAGWGAHQLVEEMKNGAWLHVPLDAELIFDVPLEKRWQMAISKLGIDPAYLSSITGGA